MLLSAEGALDRSLGWSEAEPQESAMSCGQALKERRSGLWKWNPARLVCRPFRAGSVFMHFLGFRFAHRFAPPQLGFYHPGAAFGAKSKRLGHDQKQVNELGEPPQNLLIFALFRQTPPLRPLPNLVAREAH